MTPLRHRIHQNQLQRLPLGQWGECNNQSDPGFWINSVRGDLIQIVTDEEATRTIAVLAGEWIAQNYFTRIVGHDPELERDQMLREVQNSLGNEYNIIAALEAANVWYSDLITSATREIQDEE